MHSGKGRFDLLPMCVLLRLAKHYEKGALKYEERNWEKGIPAHSFADSAFRHLVKYLDGYTDEDHLIAAIWNLCGLAWTEEKRPDLLDIPARLRTGKLENASTLKYVLDENYIAYYKDGYVFTKPSTGSAENLTQKEGDINS